MDVVYLVQAEPGGLVKIGRSRAPRKRIAALRTHSPVPLSVIGLSCAHSEGELHDRFAEFRAHGEWFQPAPELLAFVRALSLRCDDCGEVADSLELQALYDDPPESGEDLLDWLCLWCGAGDDEREAMAWDMAIRGDGNALDHVVYEVDREEWLMGRGGVFCGLPPRLAG